MALDKNVARQQAFIRYTTGKENTIKPVLLDIMDYINGRLAREGETIASKKRLNMLLRDVQSRMSKELTGWENKVLSPTFEEVIDLELDFQQKMMVNLETVRPSTAQVMTAVNNQPLLIGFNGRAVDFGLMTKSWKKEEIVKISNIIKGGYYSGDPNNRLVSNIMKSVGGTRSKRYSDGALNKTRVSVRRMVRTSMAHLSAETKAVFAKQNNDLIKGERIIATLDSSTSSECRDKDGNEVLYKDNNSPARPPFHFNCLTTFAFIFDAKYDYLDKGATRASNMDEPGKADKKAKYYDVLAKQPAEFQDEALGKAKGKIFRNAGLTPDEFKEAVTDRFGKELSIEQMKLKDKRIAEYLG